MDHSSNHSAIGLGPSSGGAATQSKKTDTSGAAIQLAFPVNVTDPTPHLAPLRDKHSAYTAVAKTCLYLNQFAINGTSSTMDDTNSVESSALFHDTSFASSMNGAFASLMECMQQHLDRRAKIVACKTLALVARATYARLRHSPHLFSVRDSTNSRLEDEVGTDVPMALCTMGLDEPDDGVAASAINALGTMALSSSPTPGSLVEDELLREIMSIVHGRPAPYAPSMGHAQDEDTNIPQIELQTRIFENVVSPRLLQLVTRVTAFDSVHHIRLILPLITASLVHLSKTTPPLVYGMDRRRYSKRWQELDYVSMVNDVVAVILLPSMKSGLDGHLSHAAALASIRLVHACPHATWIDDVCHWSVQVLKESLSSLDLELEAKMTGLASLLICSRSIPLPKRSSVLSFVFEKVKQLPSTTVAPHGVLSSGLLLDSFGMLQYRRPARAALLAEIALSYFADGPVESPESTSRSSSFEAFLKSSIVTSSIKEVQTNKVTQFRAEVVNAFCMVGAGVGRRLRDAPDGEKSTHLVVSATPEDFHTWIRMSVTMLNSFTACISWGSTSAYMEEELTLLTASQASYVQLLQEVLHATGLLVPASVSLKLAPTASPPNMLWDQMEVSASFLGKYDTMSTIDGKLIDKVAKLMESLLKKELKGNGVVSHHMRLFVLALAADHWVQVRHMTMTELSNQPNLNAEGATDLLTAMSPRRLFSKLVDSQKAQIEGFGKEKKSRYKKHAQDTVTVSVAGIENISLAVCEWRRRFGNSVEIKSILNQAVLSLQGKTGGNENDQAPVLPVCQAAIERIQAAFGSTDQSNPDSIPISPLVANIDEVKRRPVVTPTRSAQGRDSYHEGYIMQLHRQIIASRIDQCVWSAPPVYAFQGAARKQNWLRLALPPLPSTRTPQVPVSGISKFSWSTCATVASGGSDALAMTIAYSIRRNLRFDGEDEFRMVVSLRVHNITAVEVPDGLRLEIGIIQDNPLTSLDSADPISTEILKTLSDGGTDLSSETTLSSAVTVYRNQLKSGEHLTWEITLDALPTTGAIILQPNIVYRAMEDEPVHAAWAGVGDGDESTAMGSSSLSGPSGGTRTGTGAADSESKQGSDQKKNINIPGEPMRISPMVGLQPCPLVFFRDGCGDIDTFRYLWSRMPYQIPPLKVEDASTENGIHGSNSSSGGGYLDNNPMMNDLSPDTVRLAAMATIRFKGEQMPGGEITKLWAFFSLSGKRVLFVLAESEQPQPHESSSSSSATPGGDGSNHNHIINKNKLIHVRSDDRRLLCCLTGTSTSRHSLVTTLDQGLKPIQQQQQQQENF